ncbi:hypothetical protein NIES4073_70300 [Kalymmatonema gypsitolerans NIES-4073]|nr:hypothetical protein NIES4073_70300 [Scytonema sp. NIES-4073]
MVYSRLSIWKKFCKKRSLICASAVYFYPKITLKMKKFLIIRKLQKVNGSIFKEPKLNEHHLKLGDVYRLSGGTQPQ